MKKVLVVEDSFPVRQQVREALTSAGFPVLEASDGLEGLACITEEGDLSLVLCDVNMPRLSGIELIEQTRAAGLVTPFILLTAATVPGLMRRARDAGAKAWVVKPVKPALLVSAVTRIIGTPPRFAPSSPDSDDAR